MIFYKKIIIDALGLFILLPSQKYLYIICNTKRKLEK